MNQLKYFFIQSEEDIRLKENLDLIVERIKDEEEGVRIAATEALRAEIHSSTTYLFLFKSIF